MILAEDQDESSQTSVKTSVKPTMPPMPDTSDLTRLEPSLVCVIAKLSTAQTNILSNQKSLHEAIERMEEVLNKMVITQD